MDSPGLWFAIAVAALLVALWLALLVLGALVKLVLVALVVIVGLAAYRAWRASSTH